MRERKPRRDQTLGEEIGNSITHGIGAIFAIVITVLLFLKCDSTIDYVASSIYGLCMLLLYLMSCLYHSFKNGSRVKKIFRYFDHISIFLLIGGTYAPVLLCALNNTIGYIFFAVQWFLIIVGIVMKFCVKTKTAMPHAIISTILGWSGLLILPFVYEIGIEFFCLILGGGIAYSLGLIFFGSKFKYAHFIWHFFVLAGTILHFVAIYLYVF